MHVLDVSSVVDCSHSSTTSAITTKHTKNANKTTTKWHNSTNNKKKKKIISSVKRAPHTNNSTHDQCKKNMLENLNNDFPLNKTNLSDDKTGSTTGYVWTVVQIVHDTQNIVMIAVLLVFIYLFCYDKTMRT